MEAGERWMLNDVAGKPHPRLGQPRPPVPHRVRRAAPADCDYVPCAEGDRRRRSLVEPHRLRREPAPTPERDNLRGRLVRALRPGRRRHQRGVRLQGQPAAQPPPARAATTRRRWTGRRAVPLEAETFTSRTRYDALNRPIQLIAPHSDQPAPRSTSSSRSTTRPTCWSRCDVWLDARRRAGGLLDPATADLHAVTDIDYDAKGQRTLHRLRQRRQHHLRLRPADLPPDASAHPARRGRVSRTIARTARRRLAGLPGAEPALHLRPGRQHHPHPRRRAADDLLPQPARRAERRLHLRRRSTG